MTKVDEQLVPLEQGDAEPENEDDEVLVEEISIDGMCGVY